MNHESTAKGPSLQASLFCLRPTPRPTPRPPPICKADKHPLYACTKFKSMSNDQKVSTLITNDLCLNCLGPGHFVKQCKSDYRHRKCQRPNHTALHIDKTGYDTFLLSPNRKFRDTCCLKRRCRVEIEFATHELLWSMLLMHHQSRQEPFSIVHHRLRSYWSV